MMNAGLVLALLAGLLHVYIWWLESVSFEKGGRRVFGVRAEDVPVVKPWAFNQGYYNLFLGVLTIIGAARAWSGAESGLSWVDFGLLVMVGAAIVLSPGATLNEEQLISRLGEHMSKFKIPERVWFLNESLPRNANGKFVKRELKESLLGG